MFSIFLWAVTFSYHSTFFHVRRSVQLNFLTDISLASLRPSKCCAISKSQWTRCGNKPCFDAVPKTNHETPEGINPRWHFRITKLNTDVTMKQRSHQIVAITKPFDTKDTQSCTSTAFYIFEYVASSRTKPLFAMLTLHVLLRYNKRASRVETMTSQHWYNMPPIRGLAQLEMLAGKLYDLLKHFRAFNSHIRT